MRLVHITSQPHIQQSHFQSTAALVRRGSGATSPHNSTAAGLGQLGAPQDRRIFVRVGCEALKQVLLFTNTFWG